MKVYIAGPLCGEKERVFLGKIEKMVKGLGFDSYLPHRDCGLYKDMKDVKKIAKRDVDEIFNCGLMVGVLNGINVGAGTAWEMGFMQALGKKVIGLKTDRKVKDSIADVSAVMAGSVEIVESIEELKKRLKELAKS
jgi:nucleoside 2-deoxyribosyltransferase